MRTQICSHVSLQADKCKITGNSWETVHPFWALSRIVQAVISTSHDRSAFKFNETLIKEWKAYEDII